MTLYKKVIYVWSSEECAYIPLFIIPDSVFGRGKQIIIRDILENLLQLSNRDGSDYKVCEYLESEDHPSKLED